MIRGCSCANILLRSDPVPCRLETCVWVTNSVAPWRLKYGSPVFGAAGGDVRDFARPINLSFKDLRKIFILNRSFTAQGLTLPQIDTKKRFQWWQPLGNPPRPPASAL